jgi:ATP-dependent DNA ligase
MFGALHIAEMENGKLVYRGKAGTGYTERSMKNIMSEIKKLKEIRKPVKEKVLDEKNTIWIEPKLVCEIKYLSMTREKYFRGAVFMRLRPDLYKNEDL